MTNSRKSVDWPKGISQPATRALVGAGYFRLDQLAGVSESELLKRHGIGPKAIRVIQQSLKEAGLAPLKP
jgi:hypothetical protein